MFPMQVLPNLKAIDFNGRVWAYLYEEAGALSLIDTGIAGDVKLVMDAIAESGRKITDLRRIVLTHCHKDHAGTAAELRRLSGADILAHRLDAPVIRGDAEPADPVLSAAEQAIFDSVAGEIPESEPVSVDRELEDGDELEIDGGAHVIHVPGHTPGSIAIHVPRSRVLFTGDAVAAIGPRPYVGFFNADPDAARASVRVLAGLDFDIGCFGHGAPLTTDASAALRRLAASL
jgi:glyoxylase-like metal-dependent hydrolase (beta-lactamase superfamily II)